MAGDLCWQPPSELEPKQEPRLALQPTVTVFPGTVHRHPAERRPRRQHAVVLRAVRFVAPSSSSPGHHRGTALRVPAWVRHLHPRRRRGLPVPLLARSRRCSSTSHKGRYSFPRDAVELLRRYSHPARRQQATTSHSDTHLWFWTHSLQLCTALPASELTTLTGPRHLDLCDVITQRHWPSAYAGRSRLQCHCEVARQVSCGLV